MGNVRVRIVEFDAQTSLGTQDITVANLGAASEIKGAILVACGTTAHSILTDEFRRCIGFTDGIRQRFTEGNCEHGQGTTDTHGHQHTTELIRLNTPGTDTVDGAADFSEWITDGIRIDWTTAAGAAWKCFAILFAGDDCQAYAGTVISTGAAETTYDNTDPEFEPDIVIAVCNAADSNGAAVNCRVGSQGFIENGLGGSVYATQVFGSSDSQANGLNGGQILTTGGPGRCDMTSGAEDWRSEFETWDSQGWTTRVKTGTGDQFQYLALKFGANYGVHVGTIQVPNATGNKSYTGFGFKPQAVIVLETWMSALNTAYGNGRGGVSGVGAWDIEGNEASHCASDEDGAATSNCQTISESKALHGTDDLGASDYVADYVSMDADGTTVNFTTKPAGFAFPYLPILAIESGVYAEPTPISATWSVVVPTFDKSVTPTPPTAIWTSPGAVLTRSASPSSVSITWAAVAVANFIKAFNAPEPGKSARLIWSDPPIFLFQKQFGAGTPPVATWIAANGSPAFGKPGVTILKTTPPAAISATWSAPTPTIFIAQTHTIGFASADWIAALGNPPVFPPTPGVTTLKVIKPAAVSSTWSAVIPTIDIATAVTPAASTWTTVAIALFSHDIAVTPTAADWLAAQGPPSIPGTPVVTTLKTTLPSSISAIWSAVIPTTVKTTKPTPAMGVWSAVIPTLGIIQDVDSVAVIWSASTLSIVKITTPTAINAAWTVVLPVFAQAINPSPTALTWSIVAPFTPVGGPFILIEADSALLGAITAQYAIFGAVEVDYSLPGGSVAAWNSIIGAAEADSATTGLVVAAQGR